jgi:hypothetical protein
LFFQQIFMQYIHALHPRSQPAMVVGRALLLSPASSGAMSAFPMKIVGCTGTNSARISAECHIMLRAPVLGTAQRIIPTSHPKCRVMPPRPPNGCSYRRVDSDDERGRHLVANCALEKGRLVLAERPLLSSLSSLDNIRYHVTYHGCLEGEDDVDDVDETDASANT